MNTIIIKDHIYIHKESEKHNYFGAIIYSAKVSRSRSKISYKTPHSVNVCCQQRILPSTPTRNLCYQLTFEGCLAIEPFLDDVVLHAKRGLMIWRRKSIAKILRSCANDESLLPYAKNN